MRVDLKKYLFVGTRAAKERFFEKAQAFGVIDFIDANSERHKEAPPEIQNISYAIKILRSLPTTEQEELYDYHRADDVVKRILDYKHELDALLEKERVLKLEISRVEIFGDFSPDDIAFIEKEGKKTIQFFCARKKKADESNEEATPPEVIFVGADHGLDYFIAINDKPKQYDKMIEMKIDEPVAELSRRLTLVKDEISVVEGRLKVYAKFNSYLHHALIDKLNGYNLLLAKDSVNYEIDGSLFAIQGWVPVNKNEQLEDIVKEFDVFYDEVAVEESDRIPTCLQNEGAHRIGEDLVHVYDTPSETDKDPSLWVLVSFAFFFAFIVGDGGYGLIFLAVSLYLRFKFRNVKNAGKRAINLFTILAVSCIVWGFLTTSFFGVNFHPESPVRTVSAVNWLANKKADYHRLRQDETFKFWAKKFPEIEKKETGQAILSSAFTERDNKKTFEMYNSFSDGIMIELALLIGVIHVILSFARYLGRNWAGAGWIICIIGGYLYFPYYLGTASMLHYVFGFTEEVIGPNGLAFLGGGIGLALVLSLIQNKLSGFLEVLTLLQVFSDILSYLRLYALGLAGGIVSSTVNDMAGSMIFPVGILVVIFGHTINILLSVMGGVIHGLRLNFIEWYHYSFQGGGKMFNPLRKFEVN